MTSHNVSFVSNETTAILTQFNNKQSFRQSILVYYYYSNELPYLAADVNCGQKRFTSSSAGELKPEMDLRPL